MKNQDFKAKLATEPSRISGKAGDKNACLNYLIWQL